MGVTCINEMLPQMRSTLKFLHLKTHCLLVILGVEIQLGELLDIRASCLLLHRPSVPYPMTNKLACSHSQDHTLLL